MFEIWALFTARIFTIEIYFIIYIALNEVYDFRVRNWKQTKNSVRENMLFPIESGSCWHKARNEIRFTHIPSENHHNSIFRPWNFVKSAVHSFRAPDNVR